MSRLATELGAAPMHCFIFQSSAHQKLSSHVIVNIAWHNNLQDHIRAVSKQLITSTT